MDPKPGQLYLHYKSTVYEIIGIANHSETHEELVVYRRPNTGVTEMWARPKAMFMGMVTVDGPQPGQTRQLQRFELVKGEDSDNQ